MRRKVHIASFIILCVLGSGTPWDMVQVFAWGRMTLEHSRTMPLSEAVATTFDGEMCSICRMVASAKKQEQSQRNAPETKIDGNVLLFCESDAPLVISDLRASFARPSNSALPEEMGCPPVAPPPRQAVA